MNWLNVHDSEGWHPSDSSFEIEDDKREIVASLNIIFTHLTRESRETIASKPISMKFLFRFAIRRSAFNIDRLVKYLRSILETLAQTASHSPETFNFNLPFLRYPCSIIIIHSKRRKF